MKHFYSIFMDQIILPIIEVETVMVWSWLRVVMNEGPASMFGFSLPRELNRDISDFRP